MNEQTALWLVEFFGQLSNLLNNVVANMGWMIATLQWQHRETKNMPSDLPDMMIEYSHDLRQAMEALRQLKKFLREVDRVNF